MLDVRPVRKRSWRRLHTVGAAAVVLTLAAGALGCGRLRGRSVAPETQGQADRLLRKAIRTSSEGVILLPSRRAERLYELPRLNEVAQALRQPAAWCFVQRAVETMQPVQEEDRGYRGIPEGQIKMRARLAPTGKVMSVEILESGFTDEVMTQCLTRVVEKQRFPENRTGNIHHVDVVYWVSLGLAPSLHMQTFKNQLREAQVAAAVRGKECLRGRVAPGQYAVEGLNLVDREGATIVNRVDAPTLPRAVSGCVAQAFRQIELPRDPESFVRPVVPSTHYTVAEDGEITVRDERWLELVRLEQRAKREAAARKLQRGITSDDAVPKLDAGGNTAVLVEAPPVDSDDAVDVVAPEQGGAGPETTVSGAGGSSSVAADTPEDVDPHSDESTRVDPGQSGLRLRLGGRRSGDE